MQARHHVLERDTLSPERRVVETEGGAIYQNQVLRFIMCLDDLHLAVAKGTRSIEVNYQWMSFIHLTLQLHNFCEYKIVGSNARSPRSLNNHYQ
jgi:hypothetical protein